MLPNAPAGDEQVDIRHYLHILSRRRVTIAAAVVLGAGAALIASLLQTNVYTADARVVLQPNQAQTVFNPQTGQRNDPERLVDTEIQIIESKPVRDLVETKLGGTVPKAAASAVGQTDVISISITDPNPARTTRIANAYAEKYVEYKRTTSVMALLQAAGEINKQIMTLQRQADDIDAKLVGKPGATDLKTERDSLIQQIGAFRSQLETLQVQSRLDVGGVRIAAPAETPTAPSSPKPLRNTALGLFLGLMLGVGLAFLREQLDDSIRSISDVEEATGGLPVLATIPLVGGEWKDRGDPTVAAITDPSSSAAEAYRSLRTSVQFAGIDGSLKLLQLTSASASEGKTTTLANLAVTMANAGHEVIVVCCDLRRPRVHEFFGLKNTVGFTSVLLGESPLDEALQAVPKVPRLRLLASGPPPPNPSELLSHPRTSELFRSLRTRASIVLIDSPPLLPVTDSSIISRWADGVVIVATAQNTSKRALHRAWELLTQANAHQLGVVLNGVPANAGGYGYGYGYGYGGTPYVEDNQEKSSNGVGVPPKKESRRLGQKRHARR